MIEQVDIAVDADGLRFLGHVLDAYMQWRVDDGNLGLQSFGDVIGMPSPRESRRVLNLSDDQLTRVDGAYARCSASKMLSVEYGDTGSTIQKARRLGYSGPNYGAVVGRYRRDLLQAETEIFQLLLPDIEEWREEML